MVWAPFITNQTLPHASCGFMMATSSHKLLVLHHEHHLVAATIGHELSVGTPSRADLMVAVNSCKLSLWGYDQKFFRIKPKKLYRNEGAKLMVRQFGRDREWMMEKKNWSFEDMLAIIIRLIQPYLIENVVSSSMGYKGRGGNLYNAAMLLKFVVHSPGTSTSMNSWAIFL